MKAALRVLSALTEKQPPDPSDLSVLLQYAPLQKDTPPDELACEVIQRAIRTRAEARTRNAGA